MIDRTDRDGVAVLQLAHGKANTLDTELSRALKLALDQAVDADAVVLTGTGSIFSAGVDLKRLVEGGVDYVRSFLPALSACFDRLFRFPRPVVAAVNGHAIAGGCVLAAACDRKLMAAGDGRIGVPELLVGVPFPAIALETVRLAVPPEHLQAVVYGGKAYRPDEARTVGLVDEVVAADRMLATAIDAASTYARIPPQAFALTKRQIRSVATDAVARARERDDEIAAYWQSEGGLETVRRYVERTLDKGRV